MFQELRELDSLRYKETQRMKHLMESLSRRQGAPYAHFSCLDATGWESQAVHWGPNGVCAIAIANVVYLVQPVAEAQTQAITPCVPPFKVRCVRWLESFVGPDPVSVLAVATDCPLGRLQIWECTRNVLLRVVNKSQEIFLSLAWNQSFLVGSTQSGSLIVNDVRL